MTTTTAGHRIAVASLASLLLLTLAVPATMAADRDEDGLRDRFETRHGVTSPDRKDSDWAGVVDSAEDNDGDRLGNLGEQRFGTSPGNKDSDGDGTPDGAEDHDGDGRSNAREQDQRPVPRGLRPTLSEAPRDFGGVAGGCDSRKGSSQLIRCWFGVAGAATRIVLMGDSHAMVLADPVQRVASSEGWRLITMFKGGCIPVLATMNQGQFEEDGGRSCRTWRRNAMNAIKANPPDLVIITASEKYKLVDSAGRKISKHKRPAEWRKGMYQMIDQMPPRTDVLVLGDVPRNSEHPVRCLKAHRGDMSRCLTRRHAPWERKVEKALRVAVAEQGEQFATLYYKICSYDPCPIVQGKTFMWRDRSHMSGTFARRLTPSVRKILRDALAGPSVSRHGS